jgi:hypothetical protein
MPDELDAWSREDSICASLAAALNDEYSWYASGGQIGVAGSTVSDFLASYYDNKEALALGRWPAASGRPG